MQIFNNKTFNDLLNREKPKGYNAVYSLQVEVEYFPDCYDITSGHVSRPRELRQGLGSTLPQANDH